MTFLRWLVFGLAVATNIGLFAAYVFWTERFLTRRLPAIRARLEERYRVTITVGLYGIWHASGPVGWWKARAIECLEIPIVVVALFGPFALFALVAFLIGTVVLG